MAPRVVAHPGTRPTELEGSTVDTRSLAHSGHRPRSTSPEEETLHACYDGWVYMGFEDEDENREHVEVIERVPCRRCRPESL
jgi:hypothetical protein